MVKSNFRSFFMNGSSIELFVYTSNVILNYRSKKISDFI